MKNLRFTIIALLVMALPLQAVADEGMWLLQLLGKTNSQALKKAGCKLTPQQIYDINNASIKDAIVMFGGGCTGEVISNQGLVITNHHCGYGSIQKFSSVEHDYLRDGFWAMNQSEEMPAEGLTVTFWDKFVDVTSSITEALEKAKGMASEDEKEEYIEKVQADLISQAKGDNEFLDAYIVPFFDGNVYYMVVTKTYKDIRFVGAPPASIGKFGGETDNWEWPRHTGDFSMFRIYADKNNNPADYSKDNVPYTPKKFLTISLQGYKPGDYAMIIGNPGSTQRYMTSSEIILRRDGQNTPRIVARTAKENVWQAAMRADQKTNIQYASKFAGSSNYRKNSIGMNLALAKLDVVNRKKAEEKAFTEWAMQTPDREKYAKALETINSIAQSVTKNYAAPIYFMESLSAVEILKPAQAAYRNRGGLEEFVSRTKNFYKDYNPEVDRKASKALLKVFRDNVKQKEFLPACYKDIDSLFNGNIDAYVDNIFDNSCFVSLEKAQKAIADTSYKLKDDPAVGYLTRYATTYKSMRNIAFAMNAEKYLEAKKIYMQGLMEKNGAENMYPDANMTLRLTYGHVGGYAPKDGVEYKYYTTLDGVMQKENPNDPEFIVPSKLKELWKSKDYGRYALKNGEMPVCFLTNNDITGGNSGSDVLNAKGELIGLAFDGNWEAMSGDILFEPNLQRCINVDIRYVLFLIDKFGGAGYLLDEMDIKTK